MRHQTSQEARHASSPRGRTFVHLFALLTWAALISVLATGCGGSGDGAPMTYPLATDQAFTVPAGEQLAIGPFSVPDGATVDYAILDTAVGAGGPDTMNIGVATDATASSSAPLAYAVQTNIATTRGTTPPLPAGAYDLVVQCLNIAASCVFAVSMTATF